jgi:methanogenic corrinoid protein MtbC1
VIGLSVAAERWLKGLPACIRAVRAASCNAGVFVMVGGRAIINHAERTRFLGADGFAADARKALLQANNFMETTVTGRFCQFRTKLGDVSRAL